MDQENYAPFYRIAQPLFALHSEPVMERLNAAGAPSIVHVGDDDYQHAQDIVRAAREQGLPLIDGNGQPLNLVPTPATEQPVAAPERLPELLVVWVYPDVQSGRSLLYSGTSDRDAWVQYELANRIGLPVAIERYAPVPF